MPIYTVEGPDGKVYDIEGPTQPGVKEEAKAPVSLMGEARKVADKTLRGGFLALPGMMGDASVWSAQKLREGAAAGYNRVGEKTGAFAPDAQAPPPVEVWPSDALAQLTGGPISKPDTGVGKTIAGVGETTVGTMMGAGPFPKMLNGGAASSLKQLATLGAASGLGAEAGGALLEDNPAARMVGGLAGGLPVGIAQAYKGNNTAKVAREAFAGISDNELEAAIKTAGKSKAAGLDLLPNQAMGRETNLDALVSALATSKEGKHTTNTLRSQPLQIQQETELLKSALPGETRALRDINNRGQETASDVVKQGQGQASAAWAAAATPGEVIPQVGMRNFDRELKKRAEQYLPNTPERMLYEDIRDIIRKKEEAPTGGSPIVGANGQLLNPPTKGPEFYDDALAVKQAIDGQLNSFGSRKLNSDRLSGTMTRRAQEVRELFSKDGGVLEQYAPSLKAANRAYESVMNSVVNPTKKSVIGDLAGRSGAIADVNAPKGKIFSIFEAGTHPDATRSEILTMQAGLSKEDPTVYTDAAKTWLSTKISDAFEGKGARTASNVATRLTDALGSPQQASSASQGLKDTLVGFARAAGKPDETYLALPKFLNYVAMAAERPSSTGGVTGQGITELAKSSIFGRMGQVSVMTPLRQPVIAYVERLGSNTKAELDRLLTTPEGLRMLHTLSKTSPHSDTGRKAIELFLSTNAAAQSGE